MASTDTQEGKKIFLITFHITALVVTLGVIKNPRSDIPLALLLFVVLFILTLISTFIYQLVIRNIVLEHISLTLFARVLAFTFVLNLLPWFITSNFWEGIPVVLIFSVITALLSWFLDEWLV